SRSSSTAPPRATPRRPPCSSAATSRSTSATSATSRADRLRPRLEDEVERRLGGAAHRGEPGAEDDLREPRAAGQRAEAGAPLLGQRARRADEGREAVVQ